MTKSQFEVRLLVKGREITKYNHEDNVYVEGREGSNFEIELVNNSDQLVLMIPAVDGLSVTDGKEASEDSQGYLVRPKSTVKVPGWTLDNNAVAKFVFAEKKKSYAANHPDHASTDNVGVIGCLVYSRKVTEGEKIDELLERIKELEKVKPIVINPVYPWRWWNDYDYWYHNRPYISPLQPYYCGTFNAVGTAPTYTCNSVNTISMADSGINTSSDNIQQCASVFSAQSIGNNASQSCVGSNATANFGQFSVAGEFKPTEAPTEDFELGVGFGESTEFKTNNVTFDRDALLATIVIYYDTRKNLEKKGIIIKAKEEKKAPNPFPKMGCKPPKDWAEKA